MSNLAKLVSYGVLVVPSDAVITKALTLNELLVREFGSIIALDAEHAIPHTTIHQAAMPDDNFAPWLTALNPIVSSTGKLSLALTTCAPFKDGGVWWDAMRRRDTFWQLHSRIVVATEQFRDHYVLPHLAPMAGTLNALTSEERVSLTQWGQPWVNAEEPADSYRPHITVGKVPSSMLKTAIRTCNSILGTEPMLFSPPLLRVVKLGDHGTCGETMAEFPLTM